MNCGGRTVIAAFADMAFGAIALGGIVEELQPPRLGLAQFRLPGQIGVIFAGIGIEGLVVLLIDFEGFEDPVGQGLWSARTFSP